jgi:hypothetical protein
MQTTTNIPIDPESAALAACYRLLLQRAAEKRKREQEQVANANAKGVADSSGPFPIKRQQENAQQD